MTKALTPGHQDAIEYLYARGLSHRKIANALGIHRNTVYSRLDGIAGLVRRDYRQEAIAEALKMVGRE